MAASMPLRVSLLSCLALLAIVVDFSYATVAIEFHPDSESSQCSTTAAPPPHLLNRYTRSDEAYNLTYDETTVPYDKAWYLVLITKSNGEHCAGALVGRNGLITFYECLRNENSATAQHYIYKTDHRNKRPEVVTRKIFTDNLPFMDKTPSESILHFAFMNASLALFRLSPLPENDQVWRTKVQFNYRAVGSHHQEIIVPHFANGPVFLTEFKAYRSSKLFTPDDGLAQFHEFQKPFHANIYRGSPVMHEVTENNTKIFKLVALLYSNHITVSSRNGSKHLYLYGVTLPSGNYQELKDTLHKWDAIPYVTEEGESWFEQTLTFYAYYIGLVILFFAVIMIGIFCFKELRKRLRNWLRRKRGERGMRMNRLKKGKASADVHDDAPADVHDDAPADVQDDAPADVQDDAPADVPVDVHNDAPVRSRTPLLDPSQRDTAL